jgi:hypothetical protein
LTVGAELSMFLPPKGVTQKSRARDREVHFDHRLQGERWGYLLAASRSRSTSRTGGCPNSLLYSRLNCEASS